MTIHPDCESCGRRYDQECAAQDAAPGDPLGELVCWRTGPGPRDGPSRYAGPSRTEPKPRHVASGGVVEFSPPPPDREAVGAGVHPPSFYRSIVLFLWMFAEGLPRYP